MSYARNSLQLEGQKFNRWTVLKRYGTQDRKSTWLCKCDCGTLRVVKGYTLKHGMSKSCGCYEKEQKIKRLTTHGMTNSRLYRIWQAMKNRCENKKSADYQYYGARGIKVCSAWKNDFQSFHDWAKKNGYRDNLTIERIDVNGDYEPSNCRWIPPNKQHFNMRNNRMIEFRGKIKTLKEWCNELNLPYNTIHARLNMYKWSVEKAFTTPIRRGKESC